MSKKIMVISTYTPSLFWFRLDMMKEFVNRGYEVIACGNENNEKWLSKFKEYQIQYICYPVERNGINPLQDIKTLIHLKKLIKQIKPDKLFLYQVKSVIYGSIAAKLNHINEIYSLVAGVGSIFIKKKGIKHNLIRSIMLMEYKLACKLSKHIIFQNKDDLNDFIQGNLVHKNKTSIVNGSGVNLSIFSPCALPKTVTFLFIGRLIRDKGIYEYLEASRAIKKMYPNNRCLVVGPYDTNPSAMTPLELSQYVIDHSIEYHGEQEDVDRGFKRVLLWYCHLIEKALLKLY